MAKRKSSEEKPLYRAVRFEVFPTPKQTDLLSRVSQNLRRVWNEAWQERQHAYENYFRPIYERVGQAKQRAQEAGFSNLWTEDSVKANVQTLLSRSFPRHLVQEQRDLFAELKLAFEQHSVTLYDQINALTTKRQEEEFGLIPRNWQEETLDSLDGSFKSFLALRKNGDMDAKPPRERDCENSFYKIPGRSGFRVSEDTVQLSFGKLGERMVIPIPVFQRQKLAQAAKLKKFELTRDPRDMSKPGRFWISIAYEVPRPHPAPLLLNHMVYIAIGASRMGIVSSRGEFCLNLPRPDYHWKPLINDIDERLKRVVKGSRKWKRLSIARAKMFAKLGHQQKQHGQYEVIQKLLQHGCHFVVTHLKVRSKLGGLADASKPERSGAPTGANWAAQNTGNIAHLIQKLKEKAAEKGGKVFERRSPGLIGQEHALPQDQRKILIARKLREEFLANH